MGIYEQAVRIAARLGDTAEWSAAPGHGPDRAELRGPNNLLLYVAVIGDRVRVTWLIPESEHEELAGRRARYEITMSIHRDAASMARQVNRRLLPKIRGTLAELRAQVAAEQADRERRALRVNFLRAMLSPLAARLDARGNLLIDDPARGVSGSVVIRSNDTVTLELTVSERFASRIAAAIGKAARRV
jgi:hypothetical protein